MIVCAAIKITDIDTNTSIMICGYRHGNCFEIIKNLDERWKKVNSVGCVIQGFMNHKGEFLDRKEALNHALDCGQLSTTNRWYQEDHNIDELYSEDLY